MKKTFLFVSAFLILAIFQGCEKNSARKTGLATGQTKPFQTARGKSVADIMNEAKNGANSEQEKQIASAEENGQNLRTETERSNSDASAIDLGKIDLDLTAQSATMVYSQVFNMMIEPEKFAGKVIKMKGLYMVYHDEEENKDYHACVIPDATACCYQGA